MNEIKWYGNDNSSNIIAYGDVNGKRTFKISYENKKMVCYRFIEKIYEKIYEGQGELLPHYQEFCKNFDLSKPISSEIQFVIVAESRSDKKRVRITSPASHAITKEFKPSAFHKKYYRYFQIVLYSQ